MTCAVPSSATSTHGLSTQRVFDNCVQVHVAPTSWLTPMLMLTPSLVVLSNVIDTKYNVPSAARARSTSELPSAPCSVVPTLTRLNVLPPSVLFHRFGVSTFVGRFSLP